MLTLRAGLLLLVVTISSALAAASKDVDSTAITGVVTSQAEGRMEGVLVTAKADRGNTTVTVISDEQGRYAFSANRIERGKYNLSIRAAGYELDGRTVADVESDKTAHVDIKLAKTRDLAAQLTGAEWMISIPGNEDQKRALFHCNQCHSLDRVAKSTYTAEEWLSVLPRMQNYYGASSTVQHPSIPAHEPPKYPVDPELAAYLSSINLSEGRTTWPYQLKTFPRPRGANTKVIITEYEIPRAESSPHDLAIDGRGMIWYDDFQEPNIGRLDPRTGKFKEWTLPTLKPGLPVTGLTIELDKEGNPWLPRGSQGCSATMFDVKTETFHTWSVPAEYNRKNAVCSQGNVAPSGMVWLNNFSAGKMFELDPRTGDVKVFDAFPPGSPKFNGPNRVFYFGVSEKFATAETTHKMYGSAVESNGDPVYCDIEGSNIAVLDHTTGQVSLYPTPTPSAFPRRGELDSQGRFWFGEWIAGQLGMFDPETKKIEEWRPPVPWNGLYRAVADKNGHVWAGGMSTDYVYELNSKTGEWREYLLPTLAGEMRDIKVDESGTQEKIWVPLLHAGIIAKIETLQ